MPENFAMVRSVTQLELENFGSAIAVAEEAGGDLVVLTVAEVRERELASKIALKDKMVGGELPSWADTYHRLLQAGWRWRIAAYVAWASMPSTMRWPKTQDELARDVLGLTSDRVIATWKQRFPAIEQMIADISADELNSVRADVFFVLKQMAMTPDYKNHNDRRMYLEMIGAYIPTTKLAAELKRRGISSDDLVSMSDEELRLIAGQAVDSLQKRLPPNTDLILPVPGDEGDE